MQGSAGHYEVQIRLNPRYVNDKCTCCRDCEKACEIERDNDFNYGIDKTKAIYMPHLMAYPPRYVVDPKYANDERMKRCVEACEYGAIELDMQPRVVTARVGAIVWATGWRPYDATKMENLAFGRFDNVVTNVMMERYASENGPSAVLFSDLLPGGDEAGHVCAGAVSGCRGSHILYRCARAGPDGGFLYKGPGG